MPSVMPWKAVLGQQRQLEDLLDDVGVARGAGKAMANQAFTR